MARLTTLSYGGTAAIVTGMGLVVAFDAGTTSKATLISSLLVVAILVPVVLAWGMAFLCALTYFVARARGVAPGLEVLKHLAVAIVVILVSRGIGAWILARVSP